MDAVNVQADKSFDDSMAEDVQFQDKLREAGVEIIELSDEDRTALAEYIRSTTWPKLADTYGAETLEKIRESL